MIRAGVRFVGRFDHPLLAGIFLIAFLFLAAGFAWELFTEPRIGTGFMMVYAFMFAFMAVVGYAIIFAAKLFMVLDRRYDITS